jgi:hypothetical protein
LVGGTGVEVGGTRVAVGVGVGEGVSVMEGVSVGVGVSVWGLVAVTSMVIASARACGSTFEENRLQPRARIIIATASHTFELRERNQPALIHHLATRTALSA